MILRTPEENTKLYLDYENSAYKMAHRYDGLIKRYPGIVLWDDLAQVAKVGLWQATQDWNPTGGKSFNSWAYLKMRAALQQFFRDIGITYGAGNGKFVPVPISYSGQVEGRRGKRIVFHKPLGDAADNRDVL